MTVAHTYHYALKEPTKALLTYEKVVAASGYDESNSYSVAAREGIRELDGALDTAALPLHELVDDEESRRRHGDRATTWPDSGLPRIPSSSILFKSSSTRQRGPVTTTSFSTARGVDAARRDVSIERAPAGDLLPPLRRRRHPLPLRGGALPGQTPPSDRRHPDGRPGPRAGAAGRGASISSSSRPTTSGSRGRSRRRADGRC